MSTKRTLPSIFADIVACETCSLQRCRNLLRDRGENVPQPGFVGRNYTQRRILLVGQNPGSPSLVLQSKDTEYTASLRRLRDDPTEQNLDALVSLLSEFIPTWPIYRKYFPMAEANLSLDDIAYCNAVRCRTRKDKPSPTLTAARACVETRLEPLVIALRPRVVIFIGLWAQQQCESLLERHGIPHDAINCDRSLTLEARRENRERVARLMRSGAQRRT